MSPASSILKIRSLGVVSSLKTIREVVGIAGVTTAAAVVLFGVLELQSPLSRSPNVMWVDEDTNWYLIFNLSILVSPLGTWS